MCYVCWIRAESEGTVDNKLRVEDGKSLLTEIDAFMKNPNVPQHLKVGLSILSSELALMGAI